MTDPVYFTDDYPREGCRLVVEVLRGRYALGVIDPSGKQIESYGPKTARQLARMVEEWCGGFAPRASSPLDQPSCGSVSTLKV